MMPLEANVAFSLGAASVIALTLALLSPPLTTGRAYFLAGLAAAYVAYLLALISLALISNVLLNRAAVELPLATASALGPAIEEPIRTIALFVFLARTKDRGCWLAFGVGYALLESLLKLGDNVTRLAQSSDIIRNAALLSIPLAPLTLHIFLGAVAMRLRSVNAPALLILLTTFVLHFAHNFSAVAFQRPENWTFVLVEVWGRSLLFVFLTLLIVRRDNWW